MNDLRSPRPKQKLAMLAVLGLPLLATACGGGTTRSTSGVGVQDLPDRFVADTAAVASAAARTAAPGCLPHLIDPRDGTRLLLMRSQRVESRDVAQRGDTTVTTTLFSNHQGDYAVAQEGRYGLASNEWLRIDCVGGQVLGTVQADR